MTYYVEPEGSQSCWWHRSEIGNWHNADLLPTDKLSDILPVTFGGLDLYSHFAGYLQMNPLHLCHLSQQAMSFTKMLRMH